MRSACHASSRRRSTGVAQEALTNVAKHARRHARGGRASIGRRRRRAPSVRRWRGFRRRCSRPRVRPRRDARARRAGGRDAHTRGGGTRAAGSSRPSRTSPADRSAVRGRRHRAAAAFRVDAREVGRQPAGGDLARRPPERLVADRRGPIGIVELGAQIARTLAASPAVRAAPVAAAPDRASAPSRAAMCDARGVSLLRREATLLDRDASCRRRRRRRPRRRRRARAGRRPTKPCSSHGTPSSRGPLSNGSVTIRLASSHSQPRRSAVGVAIAASLAGSQGDAATRRVSRSRPR